MAKIVMAYFNCMLNEEKHGAKTMFYESFIAGLKKNGNEVLEIGHGNFNREYGGIPAEWKQKITAFSPDICFLFNNNFYDLADIVECPIVIYEVDSPMYYGNKSGIQKNPDRYLYFVLTESNGAALQELFKVPAQNIFRIHFFTEIHTNAKIKQTTNISFIGTKFKSAVKEGIGIQKFLSKNPSETEKYWFGQILQRIEDGMVLGGSLEKFAASLGATKEWFWENIDVNELVMLLSTEKRIAVLGAVADLGIKLYGTENWKWDYYNHYKLNLAYQNKTVYSRQHQEWILNSSKIGISVGHLQAKDAYPWRIMDVMASGACLVTDYCTDFAKDFPQVPIPVYNSPAEAYELCKALITDDIRRQDIVAQCNEVIDKNYRFQNLLQEMEAYSGVIMH